MISLYESWTQEGRVECKLLQIKPTPVGLMGVFAAPGCTQLPDCGVCWNAHT